MYEKYLEQKKLQKEGDEKSFTFNFDQPRLADSVDDIKANWMNDYEQYDDSQIQTWQFNHGTPNPNTKVSSVPCGGCGALLHCRDPAIPGYLPFEIIRDRQDDELKTIVCQRCHFMKYYKTSLDVKVATEEYPKLLKV